MRNLAIAVCVVIAAVSLVQIEARVIVVGAPLCLIAGTVIQPCHTVVPIHPADDGTWKSQPNADSWDSSTSDTDDWSWKSSAADDESAKSVSNVDDDGSWKSSSDDDETEKSISNVDDDAGSWKSSGDDDDGSYKLQSDKANETQQQTSSAMYSGKLIAAADYEYTLDSDNAANEADDSTDTDDSGTTPQDDPTDSEANLDNSTATVKDLNNNNNNEVLSADEAAADSLFSFPVSTIPTKQSDWPEPAPVVEFV